MGRSPNVGPTFDRLCESNCPRYRKTSFRLVLTAWCLLWRVRSQWPHQLDLNGGRNGNWKRVPKFPKHSTFAGDGCRFCRPPGKPHETKPPVNLKDQTDVRFFFFHFFPFLLFFVGEKCWNRIVADWKTAKRAQVCVIESDGRISPFQRCVWNFVFLSLDRLRIFSTDLS